MDLGRRGEFAPRCAVGHLLVRKVVDGGATQLGLEAKRCRKCGSELLKGHERYSCKPCGVHLCCTCYNGTITALAREHQRTRPDAGGLSRPLQLPPPHAEHNSTRLVEQRPNPGRIKMPEGNEEVVQDGRRLSEEPGQRGTSAPDSLTLPGRRNDHTRLLAGAARSGYAAAPMPVARVAVPQTGAGARVLPTRVPQADAAVGSSLRLRGLPPYWTPWPSAQDDREVLVSQVQSEQELRMLRHLLHVKDPSQLGVGKDVHKHTREYSSLRLHSTWRVQNGDLWQLYDARRKMLARQAQQLLHKGFVRNEARPTTDVLARASLPDGLASYPESREALLLTGVRPDTVLSILQQGLSERLASKQGAFGAGIYLAEDAAKMDQYTTPDPGVMERSLEELHSRLFPQGTHPGVELFYCFVVRVALGWSVMTRDGRTNLHEPTEPVHASGDRRELAVIRGSSPPLRYNSLVVETGAALKRFREFVVFENTQAYTEYLIAYECL